MEYYGTQYYLFKYSAKSIKDLEKLKGNVSLKLREINFLLIESKQRHLEGDSDQIEYIDLCKEKASLELQLTAILHVLRGKINEPSADIPSKGVEEYISEYQRLNKPELVDSMQKLQMESSKINLAFKNSEKNTIEWKRLGEQRSDIKVRLTAYQFVLRDLKKKKDCNEPMRSYAAYRDQEIIATFSTQVIKNLAPILNQEVLEKTIAQAKTKLLEMGQESTREADLNRVDEWAQYILENNFNPLGRT